MGRLALPRHFRASSARLGSALRVNSVLSGRMGAGGCVLRATSIELGAHPTRHVELKRGSRSLPGQYFMLR